MHHLGGWPTADIADALGCADVTARSHPLYFMAASPSSYDDGPDWRPRSEEWSEEDIGFVDGGPDTVIVPRIGGRRYVAILHCERSWGSYCVNVTVSTDG